MRFSALFTSFTLWAAASAVVLAVGSPWNGTWKLNEAKSHMTGDTFTYSQAPGGKTRYSNGATVAFDYACDGKPYTTVADYQSTCKQIRATERVYTNMERGQSTGTTRETLSSDGNVLTSVNTGTRPDGQHYRSVTVYHRVSGNGGWFGMWRNTKSSSNAASTMTFAVSGKHVTIGFPGYKQKATLMIDGPAAPLTGAQLPAGVLISLQSHGPNSLQQRIVYRGKVYSQDIYTMSADGKTITDVSWTPGKENEKETYIYEKV